MRKYLIQPIKPVSDSGSRCSDKLSSNDEEVKEDTYQLFTKRVRADSKACSSQNSARLETYTDDKALLDDKVFKPSIDVHFHKKQLGKLGGDTDDLNKVIRRIDRLSKRKISLRNLFQNFNKTQTVAESREDEQQRVYQTMLGQHLRLKASKEIDRKVTSEYSSKVIPMAIALNGHHVDREHFESY